MGHEAVASRAVPVLLAWLEEDAVAGADDLNWPTATLTQADALRYPDGLAIGVSVPCGAGARREVDAARREARASGRRRDRVNVDRAGEPVTRPRRGCAGVPGNLHVVLPGYAMELVCS